MNSDPNINSIVHLYDPDNEFEWVYREQAQRLRELLLSPSPGSDCTFSPSNLLDQGERVVVLYFIGECPFLSIYTQEGDCTELSWPDASTLANYIEEILSL